MVRFRQNPILNLCVWLLAAFALIWTGPLFVPAAGGTVTLVALLWKGLAASLALGASIFLLRRSGFPLLGLAPRKRTVSLLLFGTVVGLSLVGLWIGLLSLLTPFHLAPGPITMPELLCSAGIYLFGALLEELAFRGHALIRLKQRYGTAAAILLVSFAFGLLHLPGMTGVNAVKIVALTGLSSVLFCLAFLLSGSLWAAVGLHAGMNFMLHSLLGAGGGRGPSLFVPVYERAAPVAYDAAFWSLMLIQSAFAIGFLLLWPRLPANLRPQAR